MRASRVVLLGVLALVPTVGPVAVRAATPLTALRYASDITVRLDGITLTPADLGEDDLAGTVLLVSLPGLPPDAHVDAYALLGDGDQLLSFDTTVTLPGGVTAGPADVVRFSGATYEILFDAAAAGVPDGANVDAIATDAGDLLLSFDTSVRLSGTTFEDEDLVRYEPQASLFLPYFTGADAGVPSELDLDGAQVIDALRLLVSFDGSGRIGGVDFNDDDVLEYDVGAGTWEIVYRGAAHHPDWGAADLVALYALVATSPTPSPTATPIPSATAAASPTAPPTQTATHTPAAATPTPPDLVTPATASATAVAATATATLPGTTPSAATETRRPTATSTATEAETMPATRTATKQPTATGTPPTATSTAVGVTPATPTATAPTTATRTPPAGTATPIETIGTETPVTPTLPPATCLGDCDGSGDVVVSELVTMVNIALGNFPLSRCPAGDGDSDGAIRINELVGAVSNALNGC